MKLNRNFIIAGGFLGLTAIVLGAFGAHTLKKWLTSDQLASFEVGVKYQMYHALFLLFLSMIELRVKIAKNLLYLIVVGTTFFSGSIYLLSTINITGINITAIGWITPLGGTLLIGAWAILLYEFLGKKS